MKKSETYYRNALEKIKQYSEIPTGETVEQRFKRLASIANKALVLGEELYPENNNKMKQITILPEDFDSVIPYDENGELTREFLEVYTKSYDCPIVRAIKRVTDFTDICVTLIGINIEGVEYEYPSNYIGCDEIAKVCARALKNGKAILKLGMEIPKNKEEICKD